MPQEAYKTTPPHPARESAPPRPAPPHAPHQPRSTGGIVRRVAVFVAFTLLVAWLLLMWFSHTSEPDGWRLADPVTHAWAMSLGATGVGIIAVVVFGIATILRSVLAVSGLALGLLAANALALDNAVLRWTFIILGGLIGWILGAGITKSCGALFGRG